MLPSMEGLAPSRDRRSPLLVQEGWGCNTSRHQYKLSIEALTFCTDVLNAI